jgi:ketosteroid isomerase-like protein
MRSRRTLIPLAALALIGACSPSPIPGPGDPDRTALRAGTDSFVQRLRRSDWASVAALYTENAVLMPPEMHALSGRVAILEWMKAFPPISMFDLRVISIDGDGALAYVTGKYIMTYTPPGRKPVADTGKYLAVHRRQADGSWPMVADMFNSDLVTKR